MDLTIIVLLGVASWRGARLIVDDTILEPPRERLQRRLADGLDPDSSFRWFLLGLVTCTRCVSVWLAAGAWALWVWGDGPDGLHWTSHLLAVAAIAGIAAIAARLDE
ncbi:MAG: DUF1360 domain-containing protein [Actinomycetota bacterium]